MIRKFRRFIENYREIRSNVYENSDRISNYEKKISEINTEVEKNRQDVEKANIDLISRIDTTSNKIRDCEVDLNNSKADIWGQYDAFEYKFWQDKMFMNKTLYNESLRNRKDNYRKDFNPLVSVIIPVYNGTNYMRYAIDSALNQTYKNIEIIVVNDGSTDNGETEKVAKSYGDKIRYISKDNGGVSSALNVGIKNMKGDYFAWLSHDDIYYQNHIEENINYLRYCDNYEKIIPYSCFDFIDENGEILLKDTIIAGIHYYDYKLTLNSHYGCILRGEVNGGNVLIPRKAFDECGGFEEGNKITQEKEMWSRLLKKYTFINIPIITYSIRNHKQQVTNTSNEVRNETDKKILEIVDGITEQEMIDESESVSLFFYELYVHYEKNGIKSLAEEFYNRYKKNKKIY